MDGNTTGVSVLVTSPFPPHSTDQAIPDRITTDWLMVLKLTCMGVISLVGVIGNIFICVALAKNKCKSSECFILNLATTDLMVCAIGIPLDFYSELHNPWMYGAALCKTVWPSQTILVLVSILTLTAMSLERYRVIITPMKPKLKKADIIKVIIVIWIISIVTVCPYINALTYNDGSCEESWAEERDPDYYTLALFIIDYCIPLTIISYCYVRIGHRLYKNSAQFNDNDCPKRKISTVQRDAQRTRLHRNTRIIKIFGFAVVMFVVCMLPGDIYWMWVAWGSGAFPYEHHFKTFSNILLYANSAINPFIFGSCNLSCLRAVCLRKTKKNTTYSLRLSFTSSHRKRSRLESVYRWRRTAIKVTDKKLNATPVWETNL